MFGELMLLEGDGASIRPAPRFPMGDTGGRSEAWLRDTLFAFPEILPIRDINPAFGPLIPLCRELRTGAGPIDIAYINTQGQLTLVETKLWRNPEARRKVVAQVLDYTRAISRWSYADLQRQVCAALGRKGDVPFALAQAVDPTLSEPAFIDAVSRNLAAGRFLLLIAGDGIREDIGAMAELINRNAASAFSLGLVEVALYDLGDGGVAVQPRTLARTHTIERHVMILRSETGEEVPLAPVYDEEGPSLSSRPARSAEHENPRQAEYRAWWAPVIATPFDDPDQEPASLRWPNHIKASLPWPGTWVTAYRSGEQGETLGVQLGGDAVERARIMQGVDLADLLAALPGATSVMEKGVETVRTTRLGREFATEGEKQAWVAATLNGYINALRPRLKAMMGDEGGE